ncbi:hypothetical protein BDY19DRAFT_990994 [Irpex rosettiformis]|uniref:Uncharacterized protein n=1 Tax=Irpex rosettiformis TaxID=378272 RepID=A0ACB8UD38_9APHY|nr:hypothetical protein BDY19DRAFT_990994 [Irpex rosettiformis]
MQATSTASAFHTFLDYLNVPVQGIIVPQKVYTSHTLVTSSPREPIRFSSQGGAGVNLQSVITSNFHGLANGEQHTPPPDNNGTLAICIHWPGYSPYQKAIPLNKITGKLTYRMLALITAKAIQQWMLEVHRHNIQSTEPNADWSIGSVKFESLWLLELRQISTGLWQPVLFRDI